MMRMFLAPLAFAIAASACSAAPTSTEDAPSQTSSSITGTGAPVGCGGVRLGCTSCAPDSSEPTGASYTCFYCDAPSVKHACTLQPEYPTVTATWAAKIWLWTDGGPTQGTVNVPVTFVDVNGTWSFEIESSKLTLGSKFNVDYGITLSLVGTINGDNVDISGTGTTFPETHTANLVLGTDQGIIPPAGSPYYGDGENIGYPYNPTSQTVTMVGAGPATDDGSLVYIEISGPITAWP
jgi:hypothetical protein